MTTQTDRELLELASKAAGIEFESRYQTPIGSEFQGLLLHGFGRNCIPKFWDPLTDDGDALRLAVKLELTIGPYKRGLFVSRDENEPVIREEWQDDRYATTRRAIVRAAAEIGKAMP